MPPRSLLGEMAGSWVVDSLLYHCDTVPAESISNYYGDHNIPDGPERLKDALLHIKNIFENVGASNIIWTMQTHPIVKGAHFGNWSNLSNYYSEQFVDCHSMSAHHGYINDTLRTLSYIISECYDTLMSLNPTKPIIIIEFAVHTEDNTGISDMTNTFVNDFTMYFQDSFPMIKGWTYVNSDRYDSDYVHTGLQIDSSRYTGEINAFRAVQQNSYYIKVPILLPVGIEEEQMSVAKKCGSSFEVFPNPFNDKTEIRYMIQDTRYRIQDINLKIYDVTGRVVRQFSHLCATMYRGIQSFNQVSWDGKDDNENYLPSGIYFVKLEAGGFSQIKKLILLR